MKPLFQTVDAGLFADGLHGHDHIRCTLASVLRMIRTLPGLPGPSCVRATHLALLLDGRMSDDASEENDAIEFLNHPNLAKDVEFRLIDGDLVLVRTDLHE